MVKDTLTQNLTMEEFAELDFEPWQHSEDEWKPLTNEEWISAINPNLIAVRLAWASLYKTKEELSEIGNGMWDENLLVSYWNSLDDAAGFFEGHLMVLNAAKARMASAVLKYAGKGGTSVSKQKRQ